MDCSRCRAPLRESWAFCPACGLALGRTPEIVGERASWEAWRIYGFHVAPPLLQYLGEIIGVVDDLGMLVEHTSPARVLAAFGGVRLGWVGLSEQAKLALPIRTAARELAEQLRAPDVGILGAGVGEHRVAVQALVDAGEVNPGLLRVVGREIDRYQSTSDLADLAARLTGVDSGLARLAILIVQGLVESASASARKEHLVQSWGAMLAAGMEHVNHGWDAVALRCAQLGLELPRAATFDVVERRAVELTSLLEGHEQLPDDEFARVVATVREFACTHPHASSAADALLYAELLVEVRGHLMHDWQTRICMGMSQEAKGRACEKFLRLCPGDSVLAFFPTSIFGQGKSGLVVTKASVQWLVEGQAPVRMGLARMSVASIRHRDDRLFVAGHSISLSTVDAEAASRVLGACSHVLAQRPPVPYCRCGAPMHALEFERDPVRCAQCDQPFTSTLL